MKELERDAIFDLFGIDHMKEKEDDSFFPEQDSRTSQGLSHQSGSSASSDLMPDLAAIFCFSTTSCKESTNSEPEKLLLCWPQNLSGAR